MNLVIDKRWGVQLETGEFGEFKSKFVPDIKFRKNVHKDIIKSFRVIEKLLCYSYYEYEFYDIAVARTFHVFELALKRRYYELTKKEWDKRKSLMKLVKWFDNNFFFESYNRSSMEHYVKVRNLMTHIDRYGFGGGMFKGWISTTIDLINEAYDENISTKRKQIEVRKEINEKLVTEFKNGFISILDGKPVLCYSIHIFKVDKKDKTYVLNGACKTLFPLYNGTENSSFSSNDYVQLFEFSIPLNYTSDVVSKNLNLFIKISLKEDKQVIKKWKKSFRENSQNIINDYSITNLVSYYHHKIILKKHQQLIPLNELLKNIDK